MAFLANCLAAEGDFGLQCHFSRSLLGSTAGIDSHRGPWILPETRLLNLIGGPISLRFPCRHLESKQADVAQLVEQPIHNLRGECYGLPFTDETQSGPVAWT
jgi:hypothetical protein